MKDFQFPILFILSFWLAQNRVNKAPNCKRLACFYDHFFVSF